MARPRWLTRERVAGWAVTLLLGVLLLLAREGLPTEGWGLVVRWVIAVVLTLAVVVWVVDLVVSSVREFRRGLRDTD